MAKLYFKYGSMNSGKSSHLLQSDYNYLERNMNTLVFIPKIINSTKIQSRIGLNKEAIVFDEMFDFNEYIRNYIIVNPLFCIFIDESQFLDKTQVLQLASIVDILSIPVICYGLRTDYLGELFEGSKYLLGIADKLEELKSICPCGKNATMNERLTNCTEQIEIGGNNLYISLCRKCFCREE
jgi:thymidine kinase